MNIENREEFLNSCLQSISNIIPILQKKSVDPEAIEIIAGMLKECITYGFDQGEIWGIGVGKQLAISALVNAISKQNSEAAENPSA